ncbi:MAG: beta-propeller fold lactonase family protein, partial [Candidatus Dadabacteria bacterium]
MIDTIDVGSESFGVAVTPDGSHVYVTNCSSNTVSVIQTSDNTVVATVDVGQCPTGVAIPNNTSVFVANTSSDTVSVIQTSDNTVVATVDVGIAPIGIAVGPDGVNIYVANSLSNTVNIMCVEDPTCDLLTIDVGETPEGIASSQNSTLNLGLIYVANQGSNTITIINKPFNEIEATLDVAESPTGIAATPNGDFIYLTHFNSSMGG